MPLALLLAALAAPAANPRLFVPVLETDFPDPFILPYGGTFLAYAPQIAPSLRARHQP